jgi:hypothetical protein
MEQIESQSLLVVAARSVGHAAGKAAQVIGLAHRRREAATANEEGHSASARRVSTHARRKQEAEKLKAEAHKLFAKNSIVLGVPYRRVIGKSAANWSDKDIAYVRELIERHKATAAA